MRKNKNYIHIYPQEDDLFKKLATCMIDYANYYSNEVDKEHLVKLPEDFYFKMQTLIEEAHDVMHYIDQGVKLDGIGISNKND